MNIFKRLMGRAEMAINTARRHPDKKVQDDNQIRARAFMTAVDDVKEDEEIKAGMHLAWLTVMLWESGAIRPSPGEMSGSDIHAMKTAIAAVKKHR